MIEALLDQPFPITTPVADLCDAHGPRAKVLHAPFRHFTALTRFAGPARLFQITGPDQFLADSLRQQGRGAVAVVSVATVPGPAVFGEGMARSAEENGWAGVVIVGNLRDVALIRPRMIGVAATGVAPFIHREGPAGLEVETLHVAGAALEAGDMIVADEDGIIALDRDLAALLAD